MVPAAIARNHDFFSNVALTGHCWRAAFRLAITTCVQPPRTSQPTNRRRPWFLGADKLLGRRHVLVTLQALRGNRIRSAPMHGILECRHVLPRRFSFARPNRAFLFLETHD
jgi:hypothetical protein